ncbi:MAG: cytochrome P450 [Pseudomonadota bacterium]|nr:cytochrome P450 [Pseudomonadota bacterium]
MKPPPGPRFTVLQTLEYARDPFGTLQKYTGRYGDPFTLRLLTGPIVFTGIPEGIREIFTAHPNTFESNAAPFLEPLVGEHSLTLLDGAAHKRERALLMPPFHGTRMKTYGQLIQTTAIRRAAAWKPGQSFVMQESTQAISLEVILQAIFGIRHEERIRLFMGIVPAYFQAFTSLLVYFPPLRQGFGGIGPWSRFKKVAARFEQLLFGEIAARRREPGDRDDLLSLLLSARYEDGSAMTDQALCDELKTLLIASHETTAISLAWAFYWIHRQPEVYQCLQEELSVLDRLPHPDDLAQLPYLSAVCDEALRLYPVVAAVIRKLRHPLTLRGYALPAGATLGAAIALPHFDPALYPDPMRFRPERFLERKYTPFEYLPFGGGARRCVGAAFAVYEMKIVLGSILAQHRLALAEDTPAKPVPRTFTIGPERGVKMIYQGPVDR